MNESQLEQIINHQRLQLLYLHGRWLDIWEQNLDLRQHILDLEDLLNQAGINYKPLPAPEEHPEFNFAVEVES